MVCTLKDIARALGVTVNTVSHALADKDDISVETKRKVREKAAELGYVINRSAQFLRTGRTRIIAIVYDDYTNPYYSVVTGLIRNAVEAYGYNILIVTDTNDAALLRYKTVQNVLSTGADGIISFLDVEPQAAELIRASGKAFLMLGRNSVDRTIDCMTVDDEQGGYLATRHLIDNGHRDILMFGAAADVSCVLQRRAGYRRALNEAGIAYRDEYVLYTAHDGVYHGTQMVHIAEECGLPYTAIFCFNDLLAFQAIAGLNEVGKRVPDDVSVVGYDYIESHLFLPIGLTTIDTDKPRLAEAAAHEMLKKLAHTNIKSNPLAAPALVPGRTVRNIRGGGVILDKLQVTDTVVCR